MARVNVPLTTLTRAGTALGAAGTEVTGDATNHHYVVALPNVFAIVRNTGAGARVLTLMLAKTLDGQTATNRTVSVPAGESRIVGPFPPGDYTQADGNIWLNVEHAELKLQAYRID